MKTHKYHLFYILLASLMLCVYNSCSKDDPTTSSSSTPVKTNTNQGTSNNNSGSNNQSNDNSNQGSNNNGGSATPAVQSSDYIEITYNGATIKKNPNKSYYVTSDPIGSENGEPLKLTSEGQELFHSNGFDFFYALVHYKNKSKLLSSQLGVYRVAIFEDASNFYKNLTLVPTFEINGSSAKFVSGSHEVQLIKEVGGNVVIVGKFSATFKYNNADHRVSGKYQMTISL